MSRSHRPRRLFPLLASVGLGLVAATAACGVAGEPPRHSTAALALVEGCPESEPCTLPGLPPGLHVQGPCTPAHGDCVFGVDDDSEVLTELQRIYRGASLYYRTPSVDDYGSSVEPQFTGNEMTTPIEGTCCSSNGMGGPDLDGDDLCDWDPDVWSGGDWNALGFSIGDPWCEDAECFDAGQHAWTYSLVTQGAMAEADIWITAKNTPTCELCDHDVTVYGALGPWGVWEKAPTADSYGPYSYWKCDGYCGLGAPESLQYTWDVDCTYEKKKVSAEIPLTPRQQLGFLDRRSFLDVYPHLEEPHTNLRAIARGAIEAWAASSPPCQFPPSQGITPVEATCCSAGGLGGPDLDGDQQCDLDSEVWQTPTWATVGFTPDGDHRYVYATSSSGTGADASLTVTAHSDLDCDGVQSTFQIFVSPPALPGDAYETSCTPGGTLPRTSPGFYREMLNE